LEKEGGVGKKGEIWRRMRARRGKRRGERDGMEEDIGKEGAVTVRVIVFAERFAALVIKSLVRSRLDVAEHLSSQVVHPSETIEVG
jgi:hypothetical protein